MWRLRRLVGRRLIGLSAGGREVLEGGGGEDYLAHDQSLALSPTPTTAAAADAAAAVVGVVVGLT